MNNDLIVITFENETDAAKALGTLETMHNRRFLGVSDAVVVTVDSDGQTVVHAQRQPPDHSHDPSSQVPRFVADTICREHSEEGKQKLVDAGLDERFVKHVSAALVARSSGIFNYVPYDSLVDTRQILDVYKHLKGMVFCTSVPREVERAILKQAVKESG